MLPKPVFQNIEVDPTFPVRSVHMHSVPIRDLFYCHWHPNLELIYVEKGIIDMHIDHKDYTLYPGDLCIINPNQIHYGTCRDKLIGQVHLMVLSYAILGQNLDDPSYIKYIEPLVKNHLALPTVIPKITATKNTPLWQKECNSIVQHLLYYSDSTAEGRELAIQGHFLLLLASLYGANQLLHNDTVKTMNLNSRDRSILTYMEEHFTATLKIGDIADIFALSEDYFYRLFNRLTGQTPINYIHLLRIRYSQQLLNTSSYSISEIGYQVGFDSTSYFSKLFKKHTGMTPREYRNG